jgi:hypothetical protein
MMFFTLKYQRGLIMHKKRVLNAGQKELNYSVKQDSKNNGFDVKDAIKLLFGRIQTINDTVKSIGLNYGLKKVTAFVNFVNYPDTVLPSLKASKDIGLIKLLKTHKITSTLNISFMTAHIFTKMDASLIL